VKSTTKKSFQIRGPLRSVRVSGGAGGVKVALNGQEVVSVRNAAPGAPGGSGDGQQQTAADDLSTIKIGQFIAEQKTDQPAATPTDDEKEKGKEIVVGPITPIPAPKPQPIARLGL